MFEIAGDGSRMLISKKELLRRTGISYGQLYRWKREKLIPEEWFIKQASFTGQETFFPEDKILRRVEAIQQLKDRYSLEELARMLSPELADCSFAAEDLERVAEIDPELVPCFQRRLGRERLTYFEVLLVVAFSSFRRKTGVTPEVIGEMAAGLDAGSRGISSTGYELLILCCQGEYYAALCREQTDFVVDARLEVAGRYSMAEISNAFRLRYRTGFALSFDGPMQEGENPVAPVRG